MPLSSDRGITLFYFLRTFFFSMALSPWTIFAFLFIILAFLGLCFQLFVLIVSSYTSRNRRVMRGTKACYEHRADADISFLAKGQDRLMSACSFVYGKEFLCFPGSINSRPPNPFFAKSTIHFTAAYASDCLLLSSNLSSKYLSNDSLQRHLKDTLRKA